MIHVTKFWTYPDLFSLVLRPACKSKVSLTGVSIMVHYV
jgi:hypothetical protein